MSTTQQGNLEQVIAETVEQPRSDLAVLQMENQTIMTECRQRPRNMILIKKELAEQIESFPESAEEAIYSKPVGQDRNGQMKFAQGLSIRAAETLAEAYGYNRVRVDVSPVDNDTVRVEAVFTDFQKGRIWQDAGLVSRWYTTRNKKRQRWDEDRFQNTVVKAEASKRVRECILRSINPALKAWYEAECRKVNARLLTDDKVNAILMAFKGQGIDEDTVSELVGKPKEMGWQESDRVRLMEMYTGLRDGATTVNELLSYVKGDESEKTRETEEAIKGLTGKREEKPRDAKDKKDKKPESKGDAKDEKPGFDIQELRKEIEEAFANGTDESELNELRKKWEPRVPVNDEVAFGQLHDMVDDAIKQVKETKGPQKETSKNG